MGFHGIPWDSMGLTALGPPRRRRRRRPPFLSGGSEAAIPTEIQKKALMCHSSTSTAVG